MGEKKKRRNFYVSGGGRGGVIDLGRVEEACRYQGVGFPHRRVPPPLMLVRGSLHDREGCHAGRTFAERDGGR